MRERGIAVTQMYGSADLGVIAYESAMADGTVNEGMILEEALILEIVRPGTGDPLPDGEVGEVVVTSFNRDYPLIRFGTGDLSAVLAGHKPVRPHQRAHQGLDGPRRPEHQGARHVRDARPGGRSPAAPPRGARARASWSRAKTATTG